MMDRFAAAKPGTPLKWLFLDLNSYFASVEQHLRPALRHRPVAVVPVMSRSTCVIAASYEAKVFGVKTGTPVWEALQRCPGLVLVQAQHERYVALHHRIIEVVDQYLPVSQVCSIDEMACELMGRERDPAQAVALAQQIKQGIAQQVGETLRCSIGIAPNRFLAKVASDMQKPNGLVVLPAEHLQERLSRLSVTDLPGVGYHMAHRLHRAGVDTLPQLWALTPQQMRQLWGSVVGERFWYALHGQEIAETRTEIDQKSISHSHVMAPALREPVQSRWVARRLLVKAASRLRRLGYFTASLSLSLRLEAGPRYRQDERFMPTQDTFSLLQTLDRLWEALSGVFQNRRIKKVSLVLGRLQAEGTLSLNLFAQDPHQLVQRQTSLSRLMDQLNARYGRDTLMVGLMPKLRQPDVGTKVAFDRIPHLAEFYE
ncbi:MAG: impB/mucB/samB family protein [Candidatus Melainabacteria bacterium]|nr:impB/mucB/samB family protein [Candidatus Melainabacteria bacterium]